MSQTMPVIPKEVLLCGNIFGYLPLKYSKPSNGSKSLQFSCEVFVWSAIVISLQVLFAWRALYEKFAHEFIWAMRINTTDLAYILYNVPLTGVALVIFISSIKKYSMFIQMCDSLDRADTVLYIEKDSKKVKILVVFTVTTFLIGLNIASFNVKVKLQEFIPFWTMHYAKAALLVQFSQTAQGISDRFRKFNKKIKHVIIKMSYGQLIKNNSVPDIEDIQFATFPPSSSQSTFNLNELTSKYWQLYNAITQANTFYGDQLFFVIFSSFLQTTTSFYLFSFSLWPRDRTKELPEILLQLAWALAHFSYIVLLVWPSNDVTNAANETAQILCKLVNRDLTLEVKEQLDSFLLQLLHHKARFTAMGFFPVQKHILTSIAGTVMTYLVIMIQFQED